MGRRCSVATTLCAALAGLALGGCPEPRGPRAPAEDNASALAELDATTEREDRTAAIPLLNPPPAAEPEARVRMLALASSQDPLEVVILAQRLIAAGDVERLPDLLVAGPDELAASVVASQAARFLGHTPPTAVEVAGLRAIVRFGRDRGGQPIGAPVVLLQRDGRWRIDLRTTALWSEPDRGPRDRDNRPLSLADAVAGLEGTGDLTAVLETSAGVLSCRLFEHRAPETVANFVGLARGLRAFIDPKTGAWVRRPFYDGLLFHRAVAGALVQTGDPLGSGRGGPGFVIADELDAALRHDRPGILAMAGRGPNTAGSQFFITAAALPELDDHHSVFGVCDPVALVEELSRVPTGADEQPRDRLTLVRVAIERR